MWPRVVEILLGAWLVLSPSIFESEPALRRNEIVCGIAVAALALLSFLRPTRWAHLATGLVALWLGLFAWLFYPRPGPPAAQNDITVAILLLMFFLLPNQASRPPEPWRADLP